eukprot:jgi/Mesen1/1486/ME000132S00430
MVGFRDRSKPSLKEFTMDNWQRYALFVGLLVVVGGGDVWRALQTPAAKGTSEPTGKTADESQLQQQSRILQSHFPGLEVQLSNYPAPVYKVFLSKIVGGCQMAALTLVFAGERILPHVGFPELPAWYLRVRDNRMGAAAATWIVGNVANNALISTGAFEVSFAGELLFSKLEQQRLPTQEEMIGLVHAAIERHQELL